MLRCNMCGEQAAGSVVVADRCGHVFCTKHIDELASTCVCGEEIASAPFAKRRRMSLLLDASRAGGSIGESMEGMTEQNLDHFDGDKVRMRNAMPIAAPRAPLAEP
jgi:hypothetical protein